MKERILRICMLLPLGLMAAQVSLAPAQERSAPRPALPADVLRALDMPAAGAGMPAEAEKQLRENIARILRPTPAQRVIAGEDTSFVLGEKDQELARKYEQGRYQFPLLPSFDTGPVGAGARPSLKRPMLKFRYDLKPSKK